MAYKNSAGNSSISNEIGQWRYFSSALTKLGTYKGSPIKIQIPHGSIPEEVDWMASVAATAGNAMGVYESYREREYKKAEEYLNTHSLEDYKKQVKEKEVPFQYDYLAMSKLKEDIGKNVAQIVNQDFQNKVDRNAFQGMSPEQVDAAYFADLKDSVSELNDGTLGFSTDDYFFNKGLYSDSNAQRMAMLIRHSKVEDDVLQKKFEQNLAASIVSGVENPGPNFENIKKVLDDFQTSDYRLTPETQDELIKTFIKAVGNSQYGSAILDKYKDYKLWSGQTLYEAIGGANFEKARINAASFQYRYNAEERFRLNNVITRAIRNGDYRTLERLRDQELAKYNNVLSDQSLALDAGIAKAYNVAMDKREAAIREAKAKRAAALKEAEARRKEAARIAKDIAGQYNKLIQEARKQQKKQIEELKKQGQKYKNILEAEEYFYNEATGQGNGISPELYKELSDTGLTENQMAVAAQLSFNRVKQTQQADREAAIQATQDGRTKYDRDPAVGNFLDYVTTPGARWEMVDPVKKEANKAISDLRKAISDASSGKEALNKETGELLVYRDSNGLFHATNYYVPKGFSDFYDTYQYNSDAYRRGILSSEQLKTLSRVEDLINRDLDPIKTIGAANRMEKIREQDYLNKEGVKPQEYIPLLKDIEISGLGEDGANVNTNSAIQYTEQLGTEMMSTMLNTYQNYINDDGSLNRDDLVQNAQEQVKAKNYALANVLIVPKADLRTAYPPTGKEFVNGGLDEDAELEVFNEAFYNILENTKNLEISKDNTTDYANSYYDHKTKSIMVVDSNQELRAKVPVKAVAMEAYRLLDEQNKQQREADRVDGDYYEQYQEAKETIKSAIDSGIETAKDVWNNFVDFFKPDDNTQQQQSGSQSGTQQKSNGPVRAKRSGTSKDYYRRKQNQSTEPNE